MPCELWPIFEHNRFLLKSLSKAAADTILATAKKKGVIPAVFTALHSFGRDIKWNVHIHLSATCGGMTLDHSQWQIIYYDYKVIMPMWRYSIITLLRTHYDQLTLPEHLAQHIHSHKDWSQWLNQHYQKRWIIHFSKKSKNHHKNVKYLGSYIKRPPFAQSRLKHYDGKEVLFEYLDHNTNQKKTATFETQVFIDRFVKHIPEPNFRLINYYGILANRVRGTLLPKVYALLDQDEKNSPKILWRNLSKSSFGLDPLKCILCGQQLQLTARCYGKSISQMRLHHRELALAKMVS